MAQLGYICGSRMNYCPTKHETAIVLQNVHYINLLLAVIAVGVRAATIAVVDEARGRHVELQTIVLGVV